MSSSEIDYPELVDDALRGVARRILEQVVEQGLPGEHHFYISFATDHAEVGISPTLRNLYPEEITIVLVTNLVQQARRLADRTAFFLMGEMVEVGETESLFTADDRDQRTRDYVEGRFG